MNESEGLNMEQSRERFANEVDVALAQSARPFAIHNARKVDARGVAEHYWLVSDGSAIIATGNRDDDFAAACASVGLDADADSDSVSSVGSGDSMTGSAVRDQRCRPHDDSRLRRHSCARFVGEFLR